MNIEKSKVQSQKTAILKSLETINNSVAETLSKGDRVELIPVKDGVKAVTVRRKEIKSNGRQDIYDTIQEN